MSGADGGVDISQWQPHVDGLNSILELLRASRKLDPVVQAHVHQTLMQLSQLPDFNNYLVYILTKLKQEEEYIRAIAGLILKNNVKNTWQNINVSVREYVQREILQCIGDAQASVRQTVGTIVTTIVGQCDELSKWPSLIPHLLQCLDAPDASAVDGAFSTLAKLAEDFPPKLAPVLHLLVPKFLRFFLSPHESFRHYAIRCCNFFILHLPPVYISDYLRGIFHLANDPSPTVRQRVCHAFVLLTELRLDHLLPYLHDVVKYMIQCTADANPSLALEACDFWYVLADTKVCQDVCKDYLPTLIPLLLKSMVFSEAELIALGEQLNEDSMIPDKPQDIRPTFHRTKSKQQAQPQQQQQQQQQPQQQQPNTNGDSDGDDDGDDDDDDDQEVSEWNLRKSAAAGLDALAPIFKDRLLPVLFPALQLQFASPDWKLREAGLLAVGAVADGCIDAMAPHMPLLFPFLISQLQDPKPFIRSITCWVLGRYSGWVVDQEPEKFLHILINQLLVCLLDSNKKVQEAACSALATLEEEAADELLPYLGLILQHLMFAFTKYQAKNLRILYDAIATLADSIGANLNQQQFTDLLLPPLIQRWNDLKDDDPQLHPLLQCLTSIVIALGNGFEPYVSGVYSRCVRLVESTVMQTMLAQKGAAPPPDKEFAVCALDLISGLTEALRASMEKFVDTQLLGLLLECARDPSNDIRQSAFALTGDLARNCFKILIPILPQMMQHLSNNLLTPEAASACNNACWAIGEIAMKIGPEMAPFVPELLDRLINLINRPIINRSLQENVAITLGRLGQASAEQMAARLEEFIQRWCSSLRNIRDDAEKDSAFRGLCQLIRANPSGVVKNFVYVCDAIASWNTPKADLKEMFRNILHSFKNSLGPQHWADYFDMFPPLLKDTLKLQYQL